MRVPTMPKNSTQMIYDCARLIIVMSIISVAPMDGAKAQEPAEITFWESVRNSENAGELEAYLEAYPQGTFRDLANIRLQKLKGGSQNDGNAADASPSKIERDNIPEETKANSGSRSPKLFKLPEGKIISIYSGFEEKISSYLADEEEIYKLFAKRIDPKNLRMGSKDCLELYNSHSDLVTRIFGDQSSAADHLETLKQLKQAASNYQARSGVVKMMEMRPPSASKAALVNYAKKEFANFEIGLKKELGGFDANLSFIRENPLKLAKNERGEYEYRPLFPGIAAVQTSAKLNFPLSACGQ